MDEISAPPPGKRTKLSVETRDCILQKHGERGRKALGAIDEGRVRRYKDFYVITGSKDEHIVEDDFCTCQDFIFRGNRCWHMLAAAIAEQTGTFQEVEAWYLEEKQRPLNT